MVDEVNSTVRPAGMLREQKIGLFLLVLFALLAIALGALQIRNTIYGPLSLKDSAPNISADALNSVESLQLRDTDRDDLSDFDELYIYSTSIYLADSDSDGLTDRQEVDQGTNPLCQEGQQCAGIADESTDTARVTSSSLKILGIDPNPDFGEKPIDLNTALQDPAQIKKMLVEAGVSVDLLKKISDAELMTMVNEIMAVSSTVNINAVNMLNSFNSSAVSTTNKK